MTEEKKNPSVLLILIITIGFLSFFIINNKHKIFPSKKENPQSFQPTEFSKNQSPQGIKQPIDEWKQPDFRVPKREKPKNPYTLPLGTSPFGNGIWNGNSNLSVENGTNQDAMVKVIRFGNKNQLIRNFYIPAGLSFTAKKIPPGEYTLKVAFGIDWDKNLLRFNFDKSFSKTEIFAISETTSVEETSEGYEKITNYTDMKVTLHKVLHGNYKSHQINEEDFND